MMSVFWLWVALGFYSLGLLHAIITVVRRQLALFRVALVAITLGFLFQFVSLVELALAEWRFPASTIAEASSLFAFLITLGFLLAYWRYQVSSLSVFAFPLVFVMTLAAAVSQRPNPPLSPLLQESWLPLHVFFALAGYAALILSFLSGVMYLIQEWELKRKQPHTFFHRLPPLDTLERLGSGSLLVGFPLITIGLLVGTLGAASAWGQGWMLDPKVMLSFTLWVIYLLLIYSRVGVGWRGRKAAVSTIVGMAAILVSWSANYLSIHHAFFTR
ncbi:MAG: inner membrane protein YpjD [Terriglobia bacterium]